MKLNKIILGLTLSTVVGIAIAAGYIPSNSGDSTQVDELNYQGYNTGVVAGSSQQDNNKCQKMSDCMIRQTQYEYLGGNNYTFKLVNDNNVPAVVSKIVVSVVPNSVGDINNIYFLKSKVAGSANMTLVGSGITDTPTTLNVGNVAIQPGDMGSFYINFQYGITKNKGDKYWFKVIYSDGSENVVGLQVV